MAKWKSPIFSDIRNKLGENVVFSMWKGRQYMRSYTKPSNPKTLAQTANRLHMEALVSYWQSHQATVDAVKTLWNAAALSDLISGFNRFIKGLRGYVISSVTLAHGTFTFTLDSSALPLNEMIVCVGKYGSTNFTAANKQTLGAYTSADFTGWTPETGDFLYVVDLKAMGGTFASGKVAMMGAPLYHVDEATGALTPVILT